MAKTTHRKLAAILAADVAGYSRLVGVDEEGTLAAVKSHIDEVLKPWIASNHGRIFKTMGDAVFAEFVSVVDAVKCAVAPGNSGDPAPGRRPFPPICRGETINAPCPRARLCLQL